MTQEQPNESIINAIAHKDGTIDLFFHENCKLSIELEVGDETKHLSLKTTEGTAKELLIVLSGLYGMEDYEVCARFTEEQFKFLKKLADDQEMTIEDVLRDLVQKQIP